MSDSSAATEPAPAPPPPAPPAAAPPPPIVREEPVAHAPVLPGLTPAFAGAAVSGGGEAPRSIWDWPGPPPRRSERTSAPAPSTTTTPVAPPHEEVKPRAGALPSVPRASAPAVAPAATPSEPVPPVIADPPTEPVALSKKKERDPTIVLSPPPAPGSSARGGKAKSKVGASTTVASPPPAATAPAPAPVVAAPSAPAPAPAPPITPSPAAPAIPEPVAAASPAPAPTPTPRHASTTPPASAPPAADRPARRAHSDSVSAAFDQAFAAAAAGTGDGVSTDEDWAEVRGVFNDVAAVHVSQVRDVMLELRYGDAEPSWIESTQPALRSLRAMAGAMDLHDLVAALDEFCVAVDAAVTGRAKIDEPGKAELLRKYQRLIELIPQAFELDAERDRREPIIVEALLYQIPGVEKRTIEKLFAVGLNRLDALMRATADEIEVVAGVRQDLSEAIVEQFRTYKKGASSALSAPDPLAERRQLGDLLIMLSVANDEYVHAASKWTEDARVRKQEARKQREQAFQRIKVALARLGERDQLAKLEKLPFEERISTLDRYLSAAVPARQQPGKS